jgi:hypothetical protein
LPAPTRIVGAVTQMRPSWAQMHGRHAAGIPPPAGHHWLCALWRRPLGPVADGAPPLMATFSRVWRIFQGGWNGSFGCLGSSWNLSVWWRFADFRARQILWVHLLGAVGANRDSLLTAHLMAYDVIWGVMLSLPTRELVRAAFSQHLSCRHRYSYSTVTWMSSRYTFG